MGDRKRQHLEESLERSTVGKRIADSIALLRRLRDVYGPLPEDFLWDTDKFQKLIVPRIGLTAENVSNEYTYVGRAKARPLYEKVCQLIRGNMLLIQGAKGSGKTTVISAMVSFLLAKQKKRVVYLTAAEFCHSPVDVLRNALLVATGGCELIAELTTMKLLSLWCENERTVSDEERLLFVVDDWDRFEHYPSLESSLLAITRYHILVKLSSSSSRDQELTSTSDKPMPSFDFDGPYSQAELLTWISQSTLTADKLENMDCLTGGMPRLLSFYEEAGGSAQRFQELIARKYTNKLYEKVVKPQTTSAQLAALVRLVTTGVQDSVLASPFDFTCFYKDGSKLTPLSPFLRSRLEFYILEKKAQMEVAVLLNDIKRWSDAVRMDCIIKGRNPARVGWNLEGLIIAVMRHQGKLWGDLDFHHVNTYAHGSEADLLVTLTPEELSEGLLVVPVAFNEQALDVIYIKLREKTLEVKPVQITVSAWKHKKKKRSHFVWQQKVLPRWLAEEFAVKHQFVYLMPGSLTKEELGEFESDLRAYLELCHATGPAPNPLIEVSEVYDKEITRLVNVVSEEVLFKKFGDVHVCLKEFDRKLLRVAKPPDAPNKEEAKQCVGMVVKDGEPRPCKRWCRTDQAVWSCCPGHAIHRQS